MDRQLLAEEYYYADLGARQDAYDDLRARCHIADLPYHVTGDQPVPAQPVTHDERRDAPRGRSEIFDLFRYLAVHQKGTP